ncbi:phosphocholine-specific phospholipase C [Sphingobacterium haloxyli]|uniref:phospholipase C n=1 Tax=Sphingobacterium haloxyli TaxID=2100533 RepID=A0A2S9J145_9SPHI|nr:phospholipase C, phosphocholine-specific [Sphingobacterium haloxyli]PRD46480.1 phospholipase C, phosphocholine-specific [Sphingobacterium haloxyli]
MDNSRRDFIKKAALLSGSAALAGMFPPAIAKALTIDPAPGSTFYDAEHIVFLMQENRSFDHLYGTLKGVRGFNDPRVIDLPNKNKVWLQSNKEGKTYIPFRLNTQDTKVPWMGSTPHGWADQTDARNKGKYDKWLKVKKPYNKEYADIPLTLGYCDRLDFPFYYSLADAFTVCDQHFCSSITGTHPNRWYWMTGTIRERNAVDAKAHVWNNSDYNKPTLNWKTYPERLEEQGVSWRIYQNELTMGFGLNGEESSWLSNFGTNVMEYFQNYNVRLHPSGIANLREREKIAQTEIDRIGENPVEERDQTRLAAAKKVLALIQDGKKRYTQENFSKLSAYEKALNNKAFTVNSQDPDFHKLTTHRYDDQGTPRELNVPKGDVLHQFREDVKKDRLPTVSWLMTPANFSDHPGRPWFGSWYVNEVMEILLENPEVWKKTIFILTYDENDGFFDHVVPYAVPNPYKANSGKVSSPIDPKMDWALNSQQTNPSGRDDRLRESSLGLGFRVPLVIASPWTRGGYVNSQLFDHTSSIQFLEIFFSKKFGKKVEEENITAWRRTICGDLTSVFRPYKGEKFSDLQFMDKQAFMRDIHKSQFKDVPHNYKNLSASEIAQINENPTTSPLFPQQEQGVKPSCSIPYELYVQGTYDSESERFGLSFSAGKAVHGPLSSGSPFLVYAMNPYEDEVLRTWEYAVAPGDTLKDDWQLSAFDSNAYHLRVYAPNGFYREYRGRQKQSVVAANCRYESSSDNAEKLTGNLVIDLHNPTMEVQTVLLEDLGYKQGDLQRKLEPGQALSITLNLQKQYHWYDIRICLAGNDDWEERYAGHVETGMLSKTDPLMGGVV